MNMTISKHPITLISVLWIMSSVSSFVSAEDQAANSEATSQAASTDQPAEAPQPSPERPRVEPQPRTSLLADLSNDLLDPETQIMPLSAGEDSFDAFYRDRSGAILHGGIIFFPDDRTHPTWPIILNPLRIGLTDYGWATLAIPLPAPVTADNPIRTLPSLTAIKTTPAETSEENINADTPGTAEPSTPAEIKTAEEQKIPQSSDRYKRIMQRGITAVQALQQKQIDRIVLVGAGSGATWATALATNLQGQTNIKLLMIDAEQSNDISAPTLLTLIPELTITTLDLYSAAPKIFNNSYAQQPELRVKEARRHSMNNYHQSRLPKIATTLSGQPWLVRYTRGLLETYIIKAEEENPVPSSTPAPQINQQPGSPQPQPAGNKNQTPI
ncbi:DUF3530 family protein [Neptunomonas antarctica]|nr:DUF3530 family protein [Neptunomonas antarctica]